MALIGAVQRAARIARNYGPVPIRGLQGRSYGRTFKPANPGTEDTPPSKFEEYFDANQTGPGIWKWRHYFDIYDRHFKAFIGESPVILEIGIYSGGSLGMWHDYFGPGARVIGVDIAEECRVYDDGDKTKVYIGDQADPDFWAEVIAAEPKIDLVVDDGGHQPYQQIATLKSLLPHLSPGGVFICEDLQRAYNPFVSFAIGLARNLNERHYGEPNSIQAHVESVEFSPYVTAITRRRAPLGEIIAPKHGTEWQPFLGDRHLQDQ